MKVFFIAFCVLWSSISFGAEVQNYEKPDPTKNVLDLVNASIKRIDDVNMVQKKAFEDMLNVQLKLMNDKIDMLSHVRDQMAVAEKARLDAIRQTDVDSAKEERIRQTNQAAVLAAQVTQSAELLRGLVATTADATSKANAERMNDIAKRLQDNTNELSKRITELERIQNSTIGAQGGTKDLWIWIFAGLMVLVALGSFMLQRNKNQGGTAC